MENVLLIKSIFVSALTANVKIYMSIVSASLTEEHNYLRNQQHSCSIYSKKYSELSTIEM